MMNVENIVRFCGLVLVIVLTGMMFVVPDLLAEIAAGVLCLAIVVVGVAVVVSLMLWIAGWIDDGEG